MDRIRWAIQWPCSIPVPACSCRVGTCDTSHHKRYRRSFFYLKVADLMTNNKNETRISFKNHQRLQQLSVVLCSEIEGTFRPQLFPFGNPWNRSNFHLRIRADCRNPPRILRKKCPRALGHRPQDGGWSMNPLPTQSSWPPTPNCSSSWWCHQAPVVKEQKMWTKHKTDFLGFC